MRKAIQIMVESDPEIRVVGMARDGLEGVELVKKHRPDCVTLDLEMPRMSGLEALEIIMKEVPTPVLVVSSISTEGAEITLEAMDKGAMDFIPKTQSFVAIDIIAIKENLQRKVKHIAKHSPIKKKSFMEALKRRQSRQKAMADQESTNEVAIPAVFADKKFGLVAIGVSTGGPPVVEHILTNLPADFSTGIVIAQHMPETFTKPFADRLNKVSRLEVKEAEAGDRVTKGVALIGRGGKHLVVKRKGPQVMVDLATKPEDLLYFPSADVLFSSASSVYGSQTLGVILTGMGQDGLKGLKEVHAGDGVIVAQDEESCVVYGMPKVVIDARIADIVTSSANMPAVIQELVN